MYKFIVVDDECLIRKGILKKVENFDLNLEYVGEAENGEDAIALIKKVNPNIILMDMRMPLMDGRELLKKLNQDFPALKIIVISGYSDFEYVQKAISASVVDYILKPFNRKEIYDSLARAISSIDKEASTINKIEKIEIEKEQANYTSDLRYFTNLIINTETFYNADFVKSKTISNIISSSSYILLSIYSPEKKSKDLYSNLLALTNLSDTFLVIPGEENQNICFLLCFSSQPSEILDLVKIQAEAIYDYFRTILNIDTYISISNIKFDLQFINNAYLESVLSLDNRDIHSKQRIYFSDNIKIKAVELNWAKMDQLMFFIESGNIEKVSELLNDFFNNLELISPLTLKNIKYNCKILLTNVRNMLKEYYSTLNNFSFFTSYEVIIDNTLDFNIIIKQSQQFFNHITSLLKVKNIYSSDQLIDNIKKYIQKNYTQNITLEKISVLFFINPSYCSFLFKEKTNENFINYITKIRIVKAEELLKNTNYKVYKIAKLLGFDNDKYFFRVFKKATGYTPEEYRSK